MNAMRIGRTILKAVAPAAILASAMMASAYADHDPQLEDLIRASIQLDLDARILLSEVQRAAGPSYSQTYQVRQAVQDATVFTQNTAALANSLQFNGQAEPAYHMMLLAETRMESSIKVFRHAPNVDVAFETVQSSLLEVRFWKECNLASGGLSGPLGQLTMQLRQEISMTLQAAQMDMGYGNFWKDAALRDLNDALNSISTLENEVLTYGTGISARDTQMLLSKAKRSIVRGGFSMNVFQSVVQAQRTMDLVQLEIRRLPPVYGGGYGQGGYGQGGYGSGNGTPPAFCQQYRRGRPGR